jgi:acyl-ACP thioesterase
MTFSTVNPLIFAGKQDPMKNLPDIGFEDQFVIRTYEIDNRKLATVPALTRLLHEAAMQNVLALKLSVWDLEPQGISWVLMRQQVAIERYPKLGETIRVQTYPAGFEKFFTYRDYRVWDAQGKEIASSSSTWLLMDTAARRMVRIPDFIKEFQQEMPAVADCLPRPAGKLPRFHSPKHQADFRVGWHDLDFNMHLNNTFYITWMLEALPESLLQNGFIRQIDIQFKSEALKNQVIHSEAEQLEANKYLHRLIREGDQKELAIAQTIWK